ISLRADRGDIPCSSVRVLGVTPKSVEDLCREFGCSTASYYTWKKKYGDTNPDEARRLLGQNGLA
ncbi:transposase, partial [Deinococcus antarcticus]